MWDWVYKIDANNWAIVFATFVGPVAAVQAQKWVERAREGAKRREWVFTTLMATRQARVSPEHVRALNSIDLAFYGHRIFGKARRSERAQAVIDAWDEYRRHLTPQANQRPDDDAAMRNWEGRADELFINLLDKIARATNFQFDRGQLKGGSYSPEAHLASEQQLLEIRQMTHDMLQGKIALPLAIKDWPNDPEVATRIIAVQAGMADILERLTNRVDGEPVAGGTAN